MPNKIDPRTEKKPMSMSGGTTIDTQYPLYIEDVYPQVMQMDGHSFVQTNVAETAPPEVPLPIVVDGKIIMSSSCLPANIYLVLNTRSGFPPGSIRCWRR